MNPTPSPDTVEPTEEDKTLGWQIADTYSEMCRDGRAVAGFEIARLIRQHVAAEVARETAALRKAHHIQQKNYISLYEAVVGSGTFAGTPDAFEVAQELRKDAERLSWLERNLMYISEYSNPQMDGARFSGQLRNEARGSGGGPSYIRIHHPSLRLALDAAMTWAHRP